MKFLKKYKFEHWWFLAMLVGLVIAPWVITLTLCPQPWQAYHEIETSTLVKANLFALAWGVANILCGSALSELESLSPENSDRVGSLRGCHVAHDHQGLGPVQRSADLGLRWKGCVGRGGHHAGWVVLAAFAGFGRDRILRSTDQPRTGSFVGGLVMVVIAGALSAGISLRSCTARTDCLCDEGHGAGDIPANFAVWAIGLLGGAVINVTYPRIS